MNILWVLEGVYGIKLGDTCETTPMLNAIQM